MKARQKLMSLLGVTLLLASTILTPISTQQSSSTTNTGDKSKQSPKGAESSKSNKTEEKSETQPGAPPRSKRTRRAAPASALDVKEVDNVITEMYVTDSDGKPFQNGKGVEMWQGFQVHAKFKLANNTVNENDTTTIKLPETLRFPNAQDFEVKDSKNNVVARAKINAETKTVTLTYTDYASKHSDVSGELFFYAAVDHGKVKQETDLDLKFEVGHKTLAGGKLHYKGPGKKTETIIEKSAWQDATDKSLFHFVVAVNRKGDNLTDVKVKDRLDDSTYGVQIVSGSVRILQVEWYWENGEWKHKNDKDVTNSHQVTMDADNRGFEASLGNIGTKGYLIKYQVRANYVPTDGETFVNRAQLFDKGKLLQNAAAWLIYQGAGGKAEGYVYSMNLHKEDERTHAPLAGAKFKVTRDRNGQVIGEYETKANGEITIPKLLKDSYTIEEVKAPDGYKKSDEKIKVTPSDFGTDKVYRKTITNKKNEKVSAQLQVKKELIGRQLKDKEFTFELKKDGEQNPIQTKSNDADGKVTFDPITYTEEGTHKYVISEKKSLTPERGIYYDPEDIQVTVKVSRNQAGKLVTEVTYQGKGANGQLEKKDTFTNHYIPDKTSTKLAVTKKLIGRQLKDKEFEFDLVDDTQSSPNYNKTLQTVKNKANGEVNFEPIEYTKPGDYSYIIKEKDGTLPGITYDDRYVYVNVTVVEEQGKLKVSRVRYESFSRDHGDREPNDTLTNYYNPTKTSVRLEVNKILTGRKLQAGEFEFDLKENGRILKTVKNEADGKVQFKDIEYTKAGIYNYTITERAGNVPGVVYEPNLISATVVVEDKGGKLEVTKVTYSKAGLETKDPTFINQYTPGKTFAKLQVNKILTGRDLQNGEFEFELTGTEDHKHQVKTNDANGKVEFDQIEYTKTGEYHYTITEKKGQLGGITYDTKEVKATVKITDDGKGQLHSEIFYDNNDTTFNNKYSSKKTSAAFDVTKVLTGRNLKDQEFEFELKNDATGAVEDTAKNNTAGKVQFKTLEYDKAGVYKYIITEKNNKLGGVTYDNTEIK